ncbi:MAG: PhoH family protein [Prevotellaceae bacterium]|nr:PhoH family protein [Prevotellaceae bacterium]MCD8304186.1 PhoH family protein [Prevotellaceae bacterium]
MIEKHIILDDVDPVVFYGVNNSNMHALKAMYPKLRIVARGEVVKVIGDEEQMAAIEEHIEKLRRHCLEYNTLEEQDVVRIHRGEPSAKGKEKDALVYSVQGRPIVARKGGQQRLVRLYGENDLLFAVGPAGSGKTYVSIALAVRALKNKEIRKIILSRPAVEAGEKLGFLPGDMRDKIDPYLQPLYDALEDMIPAVKLHEMMEQKTIEIAPLAFMRGRTLNDAVVILDEAQNTTIEQIKMFLTRMGTNTKMIITGDISQIDLPPRTRSGLVDALEVLRGVEGIGFVTMTKEDIVRHRLVSRIVEAYERTKNTDNESIDKD